MAVLPVDLGSSWPQRPPHGFLVNMKLEAVDRRTPSFIRVASVEDVEDHRIKVGAEVLVLSLCPASVLAFSCSSQLPASCNGKVCGSLWKHTVWRFAGPSARLQEYRRALCAVLLYLHACCQLGGLQSFSWKGLEV